MLEKWHELGFRGVYGRGAGLQALPKAIGDIDPLAC
jgi:hypothetical protein